MKRTPVKQIPPSTLRAHLAGSQGLHQSPDPHPDADQLTAFVEDALLDRERANILAHLAACPDCRAILHTATAAEPEPAQQPEFLPRRPPLRSWLPSVALAASLLVMAASTIVFYRTLHTTPARTQTAAATPAPPLPAAPPATPAPQLSTAANAAPPAAKPAALRPLRLPSHSTPSTPAPTQEASIGASAPPPPPPPSPGISRSESLGDVAQQAQNNPSPADDVQLQAELRAQKSFHGAMAKAAPRSAPSSTQSVQVESFGASLRTAQPQLRGLIAAPAGRPRFRITDSGRLERSADTGAWLPVSVAADAHFRVISISGADVWAGGDRLRLFHSSDNGVTWTEIQLPLTADRTHAIVHIRSDTQQKLTVEDETGATFTTTDAGATWQ